LVEQHLNFYQSICDEYTGIILYFDINKFPKPPELELIAKQWNIDAFDVFFDLHVH
jgi:hypothetical protein